MAVLYRTNSYTGNPNPFHNILDIMQEFTPSQRLSVISSYSARFDDDSAVSAQVRSFFEDYNFSKWMSFLEQPEEVKQQFWKDWLKKLGEITDRELNVCCWFTTLNVALDRLTGYGRNVCKTNGILRCYHKDVILLDTGFNILVAAEKPFPLISDTVTNTQLISEDQLNRLLDIEQSYGKVLARTSLKKDVLNLFKLVDHNLLNNSFIPSFEQQERRIEQKKEQAIMDLL